MNWYKDHIILFVGLFVLLLVLLVAVPMKKIENKSALFDETNTKVEGYLATYESRLQGAVITVPELKDTLSGLENGTGTFVLAPDSKALGTITLGPERATYFIPASAENLSPRADVVATANINYGGSGTFIYVMLFKDRGDSLIEESYGRIGDRIKITSLTTSSDDTNPANEYLVHVNYLVRGADDPMTTAPSIPTETIIPVRDGHFVPEETTSRIVEEISAPE